MATRKAITLVSGLFQEVNTPTDKLDFAGNTTADLGENTNLYYTDARSRAAVSVTDSGGDGSLAYNNSTGVITYTGPSSAEARAHFSVASGSGLTYNSGTGEFGTSAIPNGQLANSSLTIGSTSVALGATQGTFAGLTSLASTTLIAGTEDAANAIEIGSGSITFEGSTADANETILTAADATGGDKTLTLPNETGTILSTASSIANSNLANSTITFGSDSVALGSTVTGISLTNIQAITKLQVGSQGGAGNIVLHADNSGGFSRGITFEGASGGVDANETLLAVTDPTADRTITLPDATGTVALLSTLSIASGSGLTYNSSTGEFSTNAIPNSKLANSSVTVGSTGIALGGSATTLTGLTSITSNAVVTNDNGFRIRDNSDNTKQLAFECSGISTSTTRTLTIPDANGTIATQAYVNSQISAEDLDVQTDSGNIDVDLNSEALILTGGTGIDTSATGTTVTYAIDSTVTTLTGSQTLTNKTLTSPVLNTSLSGSAFLDEDNMASNSATKVASQQSIKAYVDTEIAGVPQGDITAVTAGTGLSGGGTSGGVTLNIDSTVTTLTGSQTLTNKTLTSAVLNDTISGTSIKDEDNMASNSASHLATQQSIKAYVDSEIAGITGDITAVTAGTGLSGGGTSGAVTLNIDSTVATLTGSQTLTNKSLTSPAFTGSLSGDAFLDEDNMASNSATKVASQQSIKAYVDNEIAGISADITAVNAGTGLSGGGSSGAVTLAIDSTVATLTGSQTLTNKTLTSPTISNPSITGDISGTGNLILTSTDAGSSAAPEFELYRNSASPADADYLGQVKFTGESDDGSKEVYAKVTGKIDDASSGTEDGIIEFAHRKAGSNVITGRFKSTVFQLLNGTDLDVDGTITGNLTGNVTGNVSGSSGSTTGNAATATALQNARTIGGVSFDGTANINLPGVNTSGSQDTSGNAATATALETARTIAGVSFDGSANISLNNNAITNGAGYLTSVGTSNITDDAVTYAKIQNVSATSRILGRESSGAGAIEEITPANLRTMINVEDGADVTDATNVNAAGAVMNSDTTTAAMQFVVDEDNMSSDSATKVPTQQSVKAYVDSQAGATEFADNVFRVKDNSDASKKLAFECSGISGSTTRTMTVPNTDGTISTESFATAIAVALG